jgi:hypothetical protein
MEAVIERGLPIMKGGGWNVPTSATLFGHCRPGGFHQPPLHEAYDPRHVHKTHRTPHGIPVRKLALDPQGEAGGLVGGGEYEKRGECHCSAALGLYPEKMHGMEACKASETG